MSEAGPVATGPRRNLEESLDPVATARGSDTAGSLRIRQRRLQIGVVSFRFNATGEADFFRFAWRGHHHALNCLRGFFLAVVFVGHLIFIAVDRESDFGQINPGAEVMAVLKFLLAALALFRKFEFNLSRQAEAILNIALIAGQVFRSAHRHDLRRTLDGTTKDDALVFRAK